MKERVNPEEYKPGETCIYHEGGLVAVVEILARTEVGRYISFELKVVRMVFCPTMVRRKDAGEVFTAGFNHDAQIYGGWYFREYAEAYAQK